MSEACDRISKSIYGNNCHIRTADPRYGSDREAGRILSRPYMGVLGSMKMSGHAQSLVKTDFFCLKK